MRNSDVIEPADLPDKIRGKTSPRSAVINLPPEGYSLEQLEREIVTQALERNDWNQTAAARFLRIPRHTLIYRMEKYQITGEGAEKMKRLVSISLLLSYHRRDRLFPQRSATARHGRKAGARFHPS